jgi:NitT/TauT family transport system ATP-binding protein
MSYPARNGAVQALAEVSFNVQPGEFVSIVGPSGCGKSTLLKLVAGLMQASSGQIEFAAEMNGGKPQNALVFQEHGLFPWMNVRDNVAFGLEMQGVGREERREKAQRFLESVGLGAFSEHFPYQLSVGMRQRAAIARSFLADPHLLLMDEPFSALDAQSKLVLQEELLRIWKDHRKMVIYVTHDIEEAILLGDRVLIMSGSPGCIQEEIAIPLGRPRNLADRENPLLREIQWHIWKAIEGEVRRSLRLSS